MKKQLSVLAAAICVSSLSLNAAPIKGSISFSPDGNEPTSPIDSLYNDVGIGVATGFDFGDNGVADGNIEVDATTDDFNAIAGMSGTISDFQFSPVLSPSPVSPLWSIGNFSFILNSVVVVFQSNDGIILKGAGTVQALGFEDTTGTWSLSSDTTGGATFSFSSTTAAVPDAGSTVALLGLALTGIGMFSRRIKA